MKRSSFFGAMALGLLFTACHSDDILTGPEGNKSQTDKTLYVNMNIRGDVLSGTRADGDPTFDAGDGENAVKDAYFVFYDESGTLVGEIVKVQLPEPTQVTDANGSVDKYYQSVVPVSVYKGEDYPAQVVCYINPITPASLQNPLNMIQTNLRDILYTEGEDNTKLFAMSNSVYYPAGSAQPQIAVPVAKDQLFNTEAEAKAALVNNASTVVDIYVERYASKLKFQHKNAEPYETFTSLINNTNEVPVTLSFVAKRWILNASCTESYIVKSFRQEANDNKPLADNYTYTALNERINAASISYDDAGNPILGALLPTADAWAWNAPVFHRSYWGMSPAYFTKEYPEVSSDVYVPQANNELNQYYYSYNELLKGNVGYLANDGVEDGKQGPEVGPFYFHETTVGGRGLNSKNPAAAVASVILVGDYTISVENTPLDEGTTFYTYLTSSKNTPLVYFEAKEGDALATSAVDKAESMLRRFIEQTSILFKPVAGGYLPFDIADETDMKTLVAALEIAAPSNAVKGDMKIAERFRTLQFKSGADTSGIYVATDEGYKAIGTGGITLNKANQLLMQQVGFCAMYNTGSAYFNIPVKHLGWYRAGNTQKAEKNINWNEVRIGDFGVVRNHSYDINVTEILGIGTGIGGHDSPIVPPADTEDYFVAYRVNILKWAVVPQQNVNL